MAHGAAPDGAGLIWRHAQPGPMQATAAPPVQLQDRAAKRDWVAWYDELSPDQRREIRARLLTASYDEVKADPELRSFFLFHSEEIAGEEPGTQRLAELHTVLSHMRGADDPEDVERRRKALRFLHAEYQRVLRDAPWTV